jgi:hypothetical protein
MEYAWSQMKGHNIHPRRLIFFALGVSEEGHEDEFIISIIIILVFSAGSLSSQCVLQGCSQ